MALFARLKDQALSLLRKSERYTKTDMVYLASGGLWSLLGTVLSWSISLATVLAFANLIPKETYGTYQYILSIADLFGISILAGIDTALARSVARGSEGSLYQAIRTKIRWGLLGAVASFGLGTYYMVAGNTVLGWGFYIVAIAVPFWETFGLYVTYLQGKKRFDLTNLYDIGAQFVAAAILIPVLFFSHNVLVILAIYFAAWGFARLGFFYLTVKQFPPNAEQDPDMIPYGKHLTLMAAANSISSNVDTLLLWHILGPVSVAIYVFSQTLPVRAAGVIKIVNRIAFPKMATVDHETQKRSLLPKVLSLTVLAAIGALCYVFAAPYIFKFFFPKYLSAVVYTQFAAGLIILQPFTLFSTSLSAQAKKQPLYIYNFGIPLVRIAFFLLLIPPFHIAGAIAALLLTKVVDALLLTFLFYRD